MFLAITWQPSEANHSQFGLQSQWNSSDYSVKDSDRFERGKFPPRGGYWLYLTVILRGRAGYELIYITNEAVGRVGYYQLISGKSEKNNCFSKFSSNSLDFFGWNLLKSWHFLDRRRREKFFSNLQNFSTRNSPSVFPYLVKLNDNGSYHGLRESESWKIIILS